MTFLCKIPAKISRKTFWEATGFELGTLRQWILYATKRSTKVYSLKRTYFALFKQLPLIQKIFAQVSNKIATKRLAQSFKWQLEYLQNWSKLVLKNFFLALIHLKLKKSQNLPLLTFRDHNFYNFSYYISPYFVKKSFA